MATLNLGRVRGNDGFSPVIEVEEDTLKNYVLRITDATGSYLTPNLRGATFRSALVDVYGKNSVLIPFSDLELDPEQDYEFYASANTDFSLLRNIIAVREDDAVRLSVYTDTLPYTSPQLGSPFGGGPVLIGADDLYVGNFDIGEQKGDVPFQVNLLCFELDDEIVPE